MPTLSGFFGRAPGGPLKIPVDGMVALGFAVYYVPGYPPLTGAELHAHLPGWLDENMAEPLRAACKTFAGTPELVYTDDLQRGAIALPPYALLRAEAVGEEELRRLEQGYQLVTISGRDQNRVPRRGLWTAQAGAHAAAQALNGVAYDPVAMRVLPLDHPPLAGDGVVRAAEHVSFRAGTPGPTAGWAVSHGMPKFGLPEVRTGYRTGSEPPLALLTSVAQQLIDAVLRANHGQSELVAQIDFGPEGSAGGTAFRLRHEPGAGGRGGWIDVATAPARG